MNKILLILGREYWIRVRKRTFLLMTFLTPLLIAGLMFGTIFLIVGTESEKVIEVFDENQVFLKKLSAERKIKFVESKAKTLAEAKKQLPESRNYAILYIPKMDIEKPANIKLLAEKNVSVEVEERVNKKMENAIRDMKLEKSGIDKATLDKMKTEVNLQTEKTTGESSNSLAAYGIGFFTAFLIYITIFMYGSQVMRGVWEEKSSRIVEVIISSVRPFELMMGKILGIGLVGLTQFGLWIILTFGFMQIASSFMDTQKVAETQMEQSLPAGSSDEVKEEVKKRTEKTQNMMSNFNQSFSSIPVTKIIFCFLFYFLFSYLMYSAMFAAVAASVDNETDMQQFMLPITMPIIVAFVAAQAVLRDPDGSISFWMSIIPLTSPIIMMIRLPFDVPTWQLALSMVLLVLTFVGLTWVAAKIYRVGILMHGTKVNFKVLAKWVFYKM
ncbi:MAG: ABC transporter permease [Microscillaceae bacterium]|jgi:ABC-2 type transport system permease protein|nr:ABC transporter permease [Microscillaceae bacterium]